MIEIQNRESSPDNLHWLHKLETIKCDIDGEVISYKVEDFGDYYDGDDGTVLEDIDQFLDDHNADNLDLKSVLMNDVLHPIEFTLRCGVRDIGKDEQITKLRRKKAIFIINQILPRIFHHPNYTELTDTITRGVTGILILIAELNSIHTQDDTEDLEKLSNYFRAKDFLAAIALQVWSVCLYEQGIPLVEDLTLPTLRRLAMMDILDTYWNYAGAWGLVLSLLEERHGDLPRIGADKALHESTDILRSARNSIRCQVLEYAGLRQDGASTMQNAPQIFQYYPKCSAYLCQNMETSDKPHRLRCYQCHYYHWCSPACQQYSEEVAGHHEIFCDACPEDEKNKIRSQMQDYLNIPPVVEERDVLRCHSCGLVNSTKKRMHRCSKCKAVHYCSKICQVWDWNHNNHRNKCEPPVFDNATKASF